MTDSQQPEIRTCTIAGLGFPCHIAAAVFRPKRRPRGIVLAVHGLSRQKHDFDDMGRFLAARGYEVWSVDVPGRVAAAGFPMRRTTRWTLTRAYWSR